jgi:hypothetical protein
MAAGRAVSTPLDAGRETIPVEWTAAGEKPRPRRGRALARRLLVSRRMSSVLLEGTLLGLVAALGLTAWRLRRGRV